MFNVKAFGAKGDGHTDDTKAIQTALDAAAETKGAVFVPEGVFMCGELRVSSHVEIRGLANWSFQRLAGSVLKLNDGKAKGLLNLTGALGVTVRDLCLDGGKLPGATHGILFDKPDFGKEEDTPRIDGCRVDSFSGDGVHLKKIWCFSIRRSHFYRNEGWGVMVRGWDGFVHDNWFTCNGQGGFGSFHANSAITFTGNRLEWNRLGGLVSHGGKSYNITGNYFDRNFGSGIALLPRGDAPARNFSIVGNIFNRTGDPVEGQQEEHGSAHARFVGAKGVVFSGNSLRAGMGDKGEGTPAPQYGIVLKGLAESIIKDNVLHQGALKLLVRDLGEHGSDVIVKDNVGSLFEV